MIVETNKKITLTPEEVRSFIYEGICNNSSQFDHEMIDCSCLNVEYIISPEKKVTDIVVTVEVRE